MKRFRKSAIALVLALLMALQGTEPIFVQAKEAIEDVQKNADFSRPEALTEEEAGITDSTSGEQDKSQQSDADVQNETTPSEDTETQEEQTTPAEETEENPQEKEVELKEPQDYYPIPEEPEGELIDYDAISKTYKTGDKQYTTVYGGYVGTYKNEDGDTELVDNTLVKPEEADTPASEEAQEASSVVATEEKEEKTEVYQNKANDYAILLPEQMSEENGVTIENGKTRIGIIPVDGDYTHSVIKDNAIFVIINRFSLGIRHACDWFVTGLTTHYYSFPYLEIKKDNHSRLSRPNNKSQAPCLFEWLPLFKLGNNQKDCSLVVLPRRPYFTLD